MLAGLIRWIRFELPAPRMWHGFVGISSSLTADPRMVLNRA